jgi:hypothetical protein
MNAKTGLLLGVFLVACGTKNQQEAVTKPPLSVVGTWQLLSGTLIEKGDTVVTDYTNDVSFIKVINDTHFAFLKHNPGKGKGSAVDFGAGGGTYSLTDSSYTEHLDYCNEREWEGHDFTFTITLKNDTLTQRGVEKVEKAGVDRLNIETYIRVKK